jgi:hypothetical protein
MTGTRAKKHPPGRSSLLRAGQQSAPRQRPFLKRATLIAIVAGAVVISCLAVTQVWLSTSGIALPIYWLHDTFWLPFYSYIWVETFPWGLLWLAPLVSLLLPVVLEYVGLAPFLRRSQIVVLNRLIHGRFRGLIVVGDRLVRPFGLNTGLAAALIKEDIRTLRHALLSGPADNATDLLAQSCDRHEFALRLKSEDDALVLSALETLTLCQKHYQFEAEHARGLRKRLLMDSSAASFPSEAIAALGSPPNAEKVVEMSIALSDGNHNSQELAVACLAVALGANRDSRPEYRVWFDRWAALRVGKDQDLSRTLALAESLIAFEYWAATCESKTTGAPLPDLYTLAFEGISRERPRGETFASPFASGNSANWRRRR